MRLESRWRFIYNKNRILRDTMSAVKVLRLIETQLLVCGFCQFYDLISFMERGRIAIKIGNHNL